MIPLLRTALSIRNMLLLPLSQQDTKPAFVPHRRQTQINTLTHCVTPVQRCELGCYSLSIKFNRSHDRAGGIQGLQTSAGPNSTFCWQQERADKGTRLWLYTTGHTHIQQDKSTERETNGRWQFSYKKKVTSQTEHLFCSRYIMLRDWKKSCSMHLVNTSQYF